jgi:hypothetical protein
MKDNLYYYISPWIYPIMPEQAGETVISLDFQLLFYDASPSLNDNDDITVTFEIWYEGEKTHAESVDVKIEDGVVTPNVFNRKYTLPGFGFVQMSIFSGTPYFRKLELEKGYALLMLTNGGSSTVLPQSKYADGVIIANMRETGTFCLVHPAHYVNESENVGDSALLVNPYDGPLVATILNQEGEQMRVKIDSGYSKLISLESLIRDGRQSCVMYTGNNRFPGWDVRHAFDNSQKITHMDHLEYYRPNPTHEAINTNLRLKKMGGRTLRKLNYINF